MNIQKTWVLLALGHRYRAFYSLILFHLYWIREVQNSLQKMTQDHYILKEQENWIHSCMKGKTIVTNQTCCQWVGSSSGAVDRRTVSSDDRLLFFWTISSGFKSEGILGEDSCAPLNSTSNQKPNPWMGALNREKKKLRFLIKELIWDICHVNMIEK